jgi:hypothetical protein
MVRQLIEIFQLTGSCVLNYILFRIMKMTLAILSFIFSKLTPGIKLISIPRPLFISMAQQQNSGLGRLNAQVYISHTIRHTYTRYASSRRVISSSQMPLPGQHVTHTRDEHQCRQRDSNPQLQHWNGRRTMYYIARSPGSERLLLIFPILRQLMCIRNNLLCRYKLS